MHRAVLAALALAGCAAAAPAPQPAPPALAGTYWALEAIDGRPVEPGGQGEKPALAFAARSYSAYAGCNAMGGLYAQRGARLYTLTGPQTAMACGGARGQQERIVDLVMQQAPAISGDANRLALRSGTRTLGLVRMASPRPLADAPKAWQGTALAGQSFDMSWIDGDPLNRMPFPRLTFAAKTVTISHLCGKAQTLGYRQGKGTVTLQGASSCIGKLGGRTLATVTGPNGEVLLAGEGHWLGGDNIRRNRPK